jgi:hypothetical protein
MKDPRMTPVSQKQPGFKKLKAGAARKSEHRSTRKSHKHGSSKY